MQRNITQGAAGLGPIGWLPMHDRRYIYFIDMPKLCEVLLLIGVSESCCTHGVESALCQISHHKREQVVIDGRSVLYVLLKFMKMTSAIAVYLVGIFTTCRPSG